MSKELLKLILEEAVRVPTVFCQHCGLVIKRIYEPDHVFYNVPTTRQWMHVDGTVGCSFVATPLDG